MSQERYGIRRFALLNTAGYSLGIFPLENPLSVYGANNLGKSASINALQFPILARMSDMRAKIGNCRALIDADLPRLLAP